MVEVEELFAAVNAYNDTVRRITNESASKPGEWLRTQKLAQDKFKAFCELHELPVIFKEP
jgi:hypothetical protein